MDHIDRRLPTVLTEEIVGSRVLIIAIEAEKTKREQWMNQRFKGDIEEARKEMILIDTWKERAGMKEIIAKADLVVHNDRSVDEIIREIQPRMESEINSGLITPERERI